MSQPANAEITRLSDLTPHQKRSGIAAWLGWLFDGLDRKMVSVCNSLTNSSPAHSKCIDRRIVFWILLSSFFCRKAIVKLA